jgi:uncharacterized integral membrane protein
MPFVYLLIAAVAIAIAIFALQNADHVTVRLLSWQIEGAPLAAVILVSGGVGALLVSLVGLVQRWRLRSKIRQLESRLRSLEATHSTKTTDEAR